VKRNVKAKLRNEFLKLVSISISLCITCVSVDVGQLIKILAQSNRVYT